MRLVGLLTVTWLLPASWVSLSPPFSRPFKAGKITRERLSILNQGIKAFRSKYNAVPLDLTVLRAFAGAEGLDFSGYDSFGQRFQYVRLSPSNYLLRSFGSDGVQNTFGSASDMGVARWGKVPGISPSYRYNSLEPLGYYPAGLLIGADSLQRAWVGKLFVDSDANTRQLVVRHRRKNGLFMMAPHDQVEEFLWLPNGEQLIYTASGSQRHRDGVYLWNLPRDEIMNLLDVAERSLPMSPSSRAAGFFLSLAGITPATNERPPVVYVYFGVRTDGPLAPQVFFSPEQTIAFAIPDVTQAGNPGPSFVGKSAPGIDRKWKGPLGSPLALTARLDPSGGIPSQREWLELPVRGDPEQVLLAWHRFIDRNAANPLFPYSLWVLSSLYGESYENLRSTQPHDADVLRTYGTEIARALINYPMSPTYIRALAMHLYDTLMDGKPMSHHLGELATASNQGVDRNNPSAAGTPQGSGLPESGLKRDAPPASSSPGDP